jgi:hypothetical protein
VHGIKPLSRNAVRSIDRQVPGQTEVFEQQDDSVLRRGQDVASGQGLRRRHRDEASGHVAAQLHSETSAMVAQTSGVDKGVQELVERKEWWWLVGSSVVGMVVLHFARLVFTPPPSLPFLHDALMTAYAFAHFLALMLYCNVRQFSIRQDVFCKR